MTHQLQTAGRGVDKHGQRFGLRSRQTDYRHPTVADVGLVIRSSGKPARLAVLPCRNQQIAGFIKDAVCLRVAVIVVLGNPDLVRLALNPGLGVGALGFQYRKPARMAGSCALVRAAQLLACRRRRQASSLHGRQIRIVGKTSRRLRQFRRAPDGGRPVAGNHPFRRPVGDFAPTVGNCATGAVRKALM